MRPQYQGPQRSRDHLPEPPPARWELSNDPNGLARPASGNDAERAPSALFRSTPKIRDPLVDTLLAGTFRIKEIVAKGGMGRLYRAEHIRLHRDCAIKVLHEHHAENQDALLRFDREARAIAKIKNPHVVEIQDLLVLDDGRPCIVQELLLGEDLREHMATHPPLDPLFALEVALQVCIGLIAAHEAGIVHRDIKPSNIFLQNASRVHAKLLDFGVAKLLHAEDITRTEALVGTPAYMAPEQAVGAFAADERADIYGVGAVLYHMLTGRPPHLAKTATATLAQLLHEEPRRPSALRSGIPLKLEAVVQHALARSPAQRPANARDLASELESVRDEIQRSEGRVHARFTSNAKTLERPEEVRPLTIVACLMLGSTGAALAALAAIELSPTGWQQTSVAALSALTASVCAVFGLTRFLKEHWENVVAVQHRGLRLWRSLRTTLCIFGGATLISQLVARFGQEPLLSMAQVIGLASCAGLIALASMFDPAQK